MSIVKPYTFVAGDKARANEVNEDFDRLYEQVNENISNISRNALDISSLETNKADKAGDSQQKFAVADAYGASDNMNAINKQTLMLLISNSVNIIGGLIIKHYSDQPDNRISVTAGACYDSTKQFILSLSDEITKDNDSQVASATYYVYIIGDSQGSNNDIVITPDQVSPSFPPGYTNGKYRKLGYFKTDSNNKISTIVSYGIDDNTFTNVTNRVMPDMNRVVSVSKTTIKGSTGYKAPNDGYIDIIIKITDNDPDCKVLYNGTTVARYTRGGDYGSHFRYTFFAPIAKGDYVRCNFSGGDVETSQFIYCKGV